MKGGATSPANRSARDEIIAARGLLRCPKYCRKKFYLLTMLSFDAERPAMVAGCDGSLLSSG